MSRKRPHIITGISLYLMLCGLMFPIFVFVPTTEESVEFVAAQPGMAGFIGRHLGAAGMASASALMMLGMGIVGVGLWRLSPWARKAMIVVSALAVCSGIEWVIESALLRHFFDVGGVFALIIFSLPLWYFSRSKVRRVFENRRTQSAGEA